MKFLLLLVAAWLVWRWSLRALSRRDRRSAFERDRAAAKERDDLTRQDISDADYEELP